MRIIGETFGKLLVAENALDGGLRVIEIALDCAHVYIRTGLCAHLQFLYLADLAFRIEHGDAGARGVRETGLRGLAGVTGHETRQDLQCDVFECGGRSVE